MDIGGSHSTPQLVAWEKAAKHAEMSNWALSSKSDGSTPSDLDDLEAFETDDGRNDGIRRFTTGTSEDAHYEEGSFGKGSSNRLLKIEE